MKQKNKVERDDKVEMTGLVTSSSKCVFEVEIDGGQIVTCQPSGKMRQYKININVGDFVKVEMSPYDLTRGRITFRIQEARSQNAQY